MMRHSGDKRTTGFMLKKGGGKSRVGETFVQGLRHRRNWSRRFFELDVEGAVLKYYTKEMKFKGAVRFLRSTTIYIPDAVKLRGRHRPGKNEELNYFELRNVTDDAGRLRHRPFALRAPTSRELIEWLRTLRVCLSLMQPEALARQVTFTPSQRLIRQEEWDSSSSEDEEEEAQPSPPVAPLIFTELEDLVEPKRRRPPPPPSRPPSFSPQIVPRVSTDNNEAIRDLDLACLSGSGDAVAVSIAYAVHEAGVSPDHPAVRRAQSCLGKLEISKSSLVDPSIFKALDDARDADALGRAIRNAINAGVDDSSHVLLNAQARLVNLLVGGGGVDDAAADTTSRCTTNFRRPFGGDSQLAS